MLCSNPRRLDRRNMTDDRGQALARGRQRHIAGMI